MDKGPDFPVKPIPGDLVHYLIITIIDEFVLRWLFLVFHLVPISQVGLHRMIGCQFLVCVEHLDRLYRIEPSLSGQLECP